MIMHNTVRNPPCVNAKRPPRSASTRKPTADQASRGECSPRQPALGCRPVVGRFGRRSEEEPHADHGILEFLVRALSKVPLNPRASGNPTSVRRPFTLQLNTTQSQSLLALASLGGHLPRDGQDAVLRKWVSFSIANVGVRPASTAYNSRFAHFTMRRFCAEAQYKALRHKQNASTRVVFLPQGDRARESLSP